MYTINIGAEEYRLVQFYKWYLYLYKVNARRVRCLECGESLLPGAGIWHKQDGGNGFVCIPCVKKLIHKFGQKGYTENILLNLQACHWTTGKWSAEEVASALEMKSENQIDGRL